MTFEGLQIQGAIKIMEKLTVSKAFVHWFETDKRLLIHIQSVFTSSIILLSSLSKVAFAISLLSLVDHQDQVDRIQEEFICSEKCSLHSFIFAIIFIFFFVRFITENLKTYSVFLIDLFVNRKIILT